MEELNLEIENEKEHHFFRTFFFMIILFIVLLIIYGKFLGNSGFILKEYEIKKSNIPTSFNGIRIAHFADVLYDSEDNIEVFDEIIEKINAKKVDIIIFSGNLTKDNYNFEENESKKIMEKLNKLESTYGKYYVTGPNDKNNPSYDSIMHQSGFISLNDNKDTIYSKNKEQILLVGIDTPGSFINELIKDDNSSYKIVTFSESDNIEEIKDYNFDLAL